MTRQQKRALQRDLAKRIQRHQAEKYQISADLHMAQRLGIKVPYQRKPIVQRFKDFFKGLAA